MERVVTACGLQQSVTATTVSGRATYCDLMCTTTTSSEFFEENVPRKKFAKALNVALPYKKHLCLEEISHKNVTPFQGMKNSETIKQRDKLLKLEREEFMRKTAYDRMMKLKAERLGATKLQSLFRGYASRPKIASNRRRPKGPRVLSPEELRNFICDLTSKLNLSHIQGLTLKMKTKNSRQRYRIENAAAFRIQKFFKMLVARRKAKIYMAKVERKKHFAALSVLRRVLRHFAQIIRKRKDLEAFKRACCIKIQSSIRIFEARRRVRLMRAARTRLSRENEAATIIQRSFRYALAKFYYPDFEGFLLKLEDAIFESEILDSISITAEIMSQEASQKAALDKLRAEEERLRRAALAEQKRLDELARLREASYRMAQRLAEEEAERLLALEESNRLAELELFALEDIRLQNEQLKVMEELRLEEVAKEKKVAEEISLAVEAQRVAVLEAEAAQLEKAAWIEAKLNDTEFAHLEGEEYEAAVKKRAIERGIILTKEVGLAARRLSMNACESAVTDVTNGAVIAEKKMKNGVISKLARSTVGHAERVTLKVMSDREWALLSESEKAFYLEEKQLQEQEDEEAEEKRLADEEAEENGDGESKGTGKRKGKDKGKGKIVDGVRSADDDDEEEEDEIVLSPERLKEIEIEKEKERIIEEEKEKVIAIERERAAQKEKLTAIYRSLLLSTENIGNDGQYETAEAALSALLDRLLGLSPADADETLLSAVQLLLGQTKINMAKYDEAKSLFSTCGANRSKFHTDQSMPVAETKEGLATVARLQGYYTESKDYYLEGITVTTLTLKASQIENMVISEESSQNTKTLHIKLLLGLVETLLESGDYKAAASRLKELNSLIEAEFSSSPTARTECKYLHAILLRLKGLYKESSEVMSEVLVEFNRDLGPNHPKILAATSNLVRAQILINNYKIASDTLEPVIIIGSKFFAVNHPLCLELILLRSKVLIGLGQYKIALEISTDCLKKGKILYKSHPFIAECYSVCGVANQFLGVPRSAQKYFEESSEMRKKFFSLQNVENLENAENSAEEKTENIGNMGNTCSHILVCESTVELGMNAIARGMFFEAYPLLECSVKLYEELLLNLNISSHIEHEYCKMNFSLINLLLGKYNIAKLLINNCINDITEINSTINDGNEHIYLSDCLYYKGLYLQNVGDYFDSIEILKKSKQILVKIVGAKHPLNSRLTLAESISYRYPGQFEKSASLLHTALQQVTELYGENNLFVGFVLYNRATLLRDSGDIDEAGRLYPTALKILKDTLGSKNAYVSQIMGDIGECLRLEGKDSDAILFLEKSRVLRSKNYSEKHYLYCEVWLSQALQLINNNNDEKICEEGLNILKNQILPCLESHFNQMHPMIMYVQGCIGKAMNNIANIKHKSGNSNLNSTQQKSSKSNKSKKSRSGKSIRSNNSSKHSENENIADEKGQSMIDSSLEYFANYPLTPFGDTHPWVLELGGWGNTRDIEN